MKNVAEINYYGRRIKIVSTYRPLLCSTLAKMYYDNVSERIRGYAKKEVKVVVDVGACIGTYSIFYAFAFPEASVYSLEPSSESYPDLVENMKQFSNVYPMNVAAWNKNEEVEMALTTREQKDYMHYLQNIGQISIYGDSDNYREKVRAIRLDDTFKRIDYLKVDAEGADMNVLYGAEELIKKYRPILQLEVSPDNLGLAGLTMSEFLNYIQAFGYGMRDVWVNDFIFLPIELLTEEEKQKKYKLTVDQGKLWVQEVVKRANEDTAD
jgi:FkbM family methyltransferase